MSKKPDIVVRFPPSPTGLFHIGSARTALYNYLFARKNAGKFLLRIEDTDKARSEKRFEDNIFESLEWLGMAHDGEVLKQSERTEIYKNKIQELIEKGAAYISQESEGENKEVVRFKNPGGKIKFQDLIRGEVEMDVSDLKDFIIARNVNEPIYHLTVVVDDIESGVTHIIRGDDGISNTPRQILIMEALGAERPVYAHLPLVLATDKSKLSKRKHGESVSLDFYRSKGYSPEAVINFIALIGWNPGTEQEIFSMEELVKIFDIERVQKKGGILNIEKLDWINREWILKESKDEKMERLKNEIQKTKFKNSEKFNDENFAEKFLKIILDRIHRWGEVGELLEAGEFDYLFEKPVLDKEKICWKVESSEDAKRHLQKILEMMDDKEKMMNYAEKEGKGGVLWPLRYALSGRDKSPDPFTLLDILGVEESAQRVRAAIENL